MIKSALACIICTLGSLMAFSQPITHEWSHAFGDIGLDAVNGISNDAAGNIYISGYFTGTIDADPGVGTANLVSNGGRDILIASYDSLGNYRWAHNVGGPLDDVADDALFVSGAGMYVAGFFNDSVDFDPTASSVIISSTSSVQGMFLTMYDSMGVFQFARGITGSGTILTFRMTADHQNNIYIAGDFRDSVDFDPGPGTAWHTAPGVANGYLVQLDLAGNYQWSFPISSLGLTTVFGITSDENNGIYITGRWSASTDWDPGPGTASITPTNSVNSFVAKYDDTGNYQWVFNVGASSGATNSYEIKYDGGNGLYISGSMLGTIDFDPGPGTTNLSAVGSSSDNFVAKYDTAGNFRWAHTIGGIGNELGIYSIAFGENRAPVVAGTFSGTADFDPGPGMVLLVGNGGRDAFAASYDSSGAYRWAFIVSSTGSDLATKIHIDPGGGHLLTGYFEQTADFDPTAGNALHTSAGLFEGFVARYRENPSCLTLNGSVAVTSNFGGHPVSCAGSMDGTAMASGSGGVPPYGYLWSNGQTTDTASGLSAGTYVVTISDNNGCMHVDSILLADPPVLLGNPSVLSNHSGRDISCPGAMDGTIGSAGSGGVAPYAYQWGPNAGNDTTAQVDSLGAGTYALTITDANGCMDSSIVILNDPPQLGGSLATIIPADASCNGLAAVTAVGGTAPYSFQWGLGTGNQIGSTASNLCDGSYCVTITDVNGCTWDTCGITVPIGIEGPTAFAVTVAPNPNNGRFVLNWSSLPVLGEGKLEMVDVRGRRVVAQEIGLNASQGEWEVDVSELVSGMYVLRLSGQEFVWNGRVSIRN